MSTYSQEPTMKTRLCLFLLLLFVLPALALANPPAPIAVTGQSTSYATGDDGSYKAGVPWPTPRFTDNGDGTVTDHLTDLIWLKNANCFNTSSWASALTSAGSLASGSCGLSDGSTSGQWRLPNINELESLVDVGRFSPSLPAGYLFTSVQSGAYWSSSTYAVGTDNSWLVDMNNGFVSLGFKFDFYHIWPVRGGQ